jgi:hypothetical protein
VIEIYQQRHMMHILFGYMTVSKILIFECSHPFRAGWMSLKGEGSDFSIGASRTRCYMKTNTCNE